MASLMWGVDSMDGPGRLVCPRSPITTRHQGTSPNDGYPRSKKSHFAVLTKYGGGAELGKDKTKIHGVSMRRQNPVDRGSKQREKEPAGC